MNLNDKYYKLMIKCKNLDGEENYINSVKINGISKKLKYLKIPVLACYDEKNNIMVDVITGKLFYPLGSNQELEYINFKEAESKDLILLQKIMRGQMYPKIAKLYNSRLETINETPNEYLLKRKK